MLETSKGIEVLTMEQSSVDTNNQQERQVNIAWLAGIWEGEGSISIVAGSGKRLMPRASVINTDFGLIEEIAKVLDSLPVGYYVQVRKNGCDGDPKHRYAKVITIAGMKRVSKFLEFVASFMRGNKRLVAKEVKIFCDKRIAQGPQSRYSNEDFEFVKRVRALNQKGPLESSETIRWTLPKMVNEEIVQVA